MLLYTENWQSHSNVFITNNRPGEESCFKLMQSSFTPDEFKPASVDASDLKPDSSRWRFSSMFFHWSYFLLCVKGNLLCSGLQLHLNVGAGEMMVHVGFGFG